MKVKESTATYTKNSCKANKEFLAECVEDLMLEENVLIGLFIRL